MRKVLFITSNEPGDVIIKGKSFSGYADLADKTFSEDIAYLSLLGFLNSSFYPGRAYIEALGLGLGPGDDVCANAAIASITEEGFLDRAVKPDSDDLEYIAEILDGTEIDGVHFGVNSSDNGLLIRLEGEELSEDVSPNYSSGGRNAVGQIIAAHENAKRTASILNKFITRTHKTLKQTRLKTRPKPNIVLIKSIGRRKEIAGFSPMKGRALCLSENIVPKGIARYIGMKISEKAPKNIFGLFAEYDFVWLDNGSAKRIIEGILKGITVVSASLSKEKFGMLTYPCRVEISGEFKKKMVFERNELIPWILKS